MKDFHMSPKITRTWTLSGHEHHGWGFCYCCGGTTEGGSDFCSGHCSSIFYDVVPNHRNQLPPAQFQHDCPKCQFLGGFNEYDLYICRRLGPSRTNTSLIARFGNDTHEYIASLVPESFAGNPEKFCLDADEWYRVLICRAQAFNLL